MSMQLRASSGMYRILLRALPGWVRRRAALDMQDAFNARMQETSGFRRRIQTAVREYAALLRIAAMERVREPSRGWMQQESPHRTRLIPGLLYEMRQAARGLHRRRAVSALAVLTFGLGIGASTAMFSVVDAVLLKPLPYAQPDELAYVFPTIEEWKNDPVLSRSWERGYWSQYEIQQYFGRQKSFSAIGAYNAGSARVRKARGSERIPTSRVTASLAGALGVAPMLGRFFTNEETEPVIILSYSFWQSWFGADPNVVGKTVEVDGTRNTVIGVMPRSFELAEAPAQILMPLPIAASSDYSGMMGNHMYPKVIGRLRPGVTPEFAQTEASAVLSSVAPNTPKHRSTHHARVTRPLDELTKNVRTPLLLLSSASVVLLIVACANVALLLLGNGLERRQELAVRGALGAGGTRIARQLLTETLVLCGAGALLGLLMAMVLSKALIHLAPEGLPRIDHVAIDPRTLAFTIGLTALIGVIVGMVPALSLSRVDPASILRAATTVGGRRRVQSAVIVLELALATVLLVGAGLLTRTMSRLESVQPGFNANNLLTVQMALPYDRFANMPGVKNSNDMGLKVDAYFTALLQELRGVPGIEAVATTTSMPFSSRSGSGPVEPEGYVAAPDEIIDAEWHFISGNYFSVLEIAALEGRTFVDADNRLDGEKTMVVDENFARRFWPDRRWLDRHVTMWGTTYRVIGVVPHVVQRDVRGEKNDVRFYIPGRQAVSSDGDLLIRTQGDPSALMAAVRNRLWQYDPDIAITSMMPMRERIAGTVADYRYRMRLMVAFAGLAAMFSVLGVYGITNRSVAHRTQELGIRLALGARRTTVLSHVLGGGVRLALFGGVAGLALSFYLVRLVQSMLWGVPATDVTTFVAIGVAVVVMCVIGTLQPALRASRLDPMVALRNTPR